jgi:hypothetical protein
MKTQGENPLVKEENYICGEIDYTPMDSSIALMKSVIYSMIPNRRKLSCDSSSTDRSTIMDSSGPDLIENDSLCDLSKKLMDPDQ